MNYREPRWVTRILSAFKYFMASAMMLEGVTTIFSPILHTDKLGFIYESHVALALFGIWFFAAGFTLLVGKLGKNPKVIGWGLINITLAFLFGFILQFYAFPQDTDVWVSNLIWFVVMSVLYLRHRLRYFYKPAHVIVSEIKES